MSALNSSLLLGADAGSTQYQVSRSLRFNSSDGAYCSRVPGSAGNRKTFTLSTWIKKSRFGAEQAILSARTGAGTPYTRLIFRSDDTLWAHSDTGLSQITTQVFRDPSAWLHLVWAVDTTSVTASSRSRLYVNGTEVTTFSTANYPTQNTDLAVNSTVSHEIGVELVNGTYLSGYLAECYLIDGQQLTPSSFGETNSTTGQWSPKAYTGSYGTNGFKLDFADNSAATAAALGKDTSGNGNNWTPNNLSVTAGAGNDSLVDTPVSSGTDAGNGGEVRGNYATLNPIAGGATLTNGNLDFTCSGSSTFNNRQSRATIAIPQSGKWYWEYTVSSAGEMAVGVVDTQTSVVSWYYRYDIGGFQNVKINDVQVAAIAGYTNGDIIGVGYDADNSQIRFYKNGAQVGTNYSLTNTGRLIPYVEQASSTGSCSGVTNFGQRPFAYTAPSGFKCLADTSLPTPVVAKPSTVFDTKLYTGNGSSQNITGLGFSPDFVWIKARSQPYSNTVFDAIRGATNYLYTDTTGAEATNAQFLTAFNSDGFSLGTNAAVNQSSTTYVAWTWDAGSSNSTNTQGSITSTVRANASAGFSVVTFSTSSPSNSTAGHGLGVAPSLIIMKSRTAQTSGYENWFVYHSSIPTSYLLLNSTGAAGGAGSPGWGTISSTVIGVTSSFYTTGNYVAYCSAPVSGYSSFGSYTGNGNTSGDGPFVFCGFRPRYVLIRNVSRAENWIVHDTARDPYNVTTAELIPNSSGAEGTTTPFDILSNGFKIRNTSINNGINASNETHIYCAFAESPFQYARAR